MKGNKRLLFFGSVGNQYNMVELRKNLPEQTSHLIVYRTLILFALLLLVSSVSMAQVTTSSMYGSVLGSEKEPLPGATVVAVHEPSGTQYATVTNKEGHFDLQGMRVGGPYSVKVSFIGYVTTTYSDIKLFLGESFLLSAMLKESVTEVEEIEVIGSRPSAFRTEKTGATTNISQEQIAYMPSLDRSISDMARISPYSNGMSFAGGDGRSSNFTVDGANLNNNFGLSSSLPGGGNPISIDAIDEIQVVIAPFDVRQTNFIGGGINAITKSGTNELKGSAYVYYQSQDFRGNKIEGVDQGARPEESNTVFGATLGGPIIKNKLFFFVNFEKSKTPSEVVKYRAREDYETAGGMISRTTISDMQLVYDHLLEKYNYDAGSFTDFPADESNIKLLARIDWNITNAHKLSLRYNNTKNSIWKTPNASSSDTGYTLRNTYRVGSQSMSYANSLYSLDNKVSSWSADLNSRFSSKMSNQLLFTFSKIEDIRGTNSSMFPFIDIMAGTDDDGDQIMEPYISVGYELFTFNNGITNQISNITDNFTYLAGNHKLTAGLSYEKQFADNAYMRNGTGYYRYNSVEDFLNDAAPESFAVTYGFNGNEKPCARTTFSQFGFYLQDEWRVNNNFKLTYGVRFDELMFDESEIERNNAIYELDFGGVHVDTGRWPDNKLQISPRIGYVWDVNGDKSLKIRGGTGIFTGRLPLVFLTNMPSNANMIQNSVEFKTTYKNDVPVSYDSRLDQFVGGMITDVDELISTFNLPTTIQSHYAGNTIGGVAENFRMPQVWKTSIAVDYQIPVSFPLSVSGEVMFTKNINASVLRNINVMDSTGWSHFGGADDRLIYPDTYKYVTGKNAIILDNTSEGYGYTANVTLNAEPVNNLNLMLSYIRTESKEVTGLPGSNPVATWEGMPSINGANYSSAQRSRYVIPDKLIGSINYYIPFKHKGLTRGTHLSLFYEGHSDYGYSFLYTNDMNGDGVSNDLMYIPLDDSEINFADAADRKAFWAFVDQDKYLSSHKGEYAEAYAARSPWYHTFDFRIVEDFCFKVGGKDQTFQLSLDIMNVGNLINSNWGLYTTNDVSNYCMILKYEGMDANNVPNYSMYKVNGEYPTETYSTYSSYTQCWRMQFGVRYIFN